MEVIMFRKRGKKFISLFMIFLLMFSNVSIPTISAEATDSDQDEMIQIRSDSDWRGSVFGSVGGNDKITSENFTIHEVEEGVRVSSRNKRGKIASQTEGIAYYFQEIPEDKDFKL